MKAKFKLFVYRDSLTSNRAVANIRRIGDEVLGGQFDLELIDVLQEPDAAARYRIVSTPTLFLETPPPSRRVTGDLSDRTRLLRALGLGDAVRSNDRESREP